MSDTTLRRMLEFVAPQGEPVLEIPGVAPTESSRYGLGINVEEVAGHRVVTHGGGMVGYSTFFLTDLDAGVGVVVLTNANGDAPHSELLARSGHAALCSPTYGGLSGTAGGYPPAVPDNSETRVRADADGAVLTGVFANADAALPDLVVTSDHSGFLVVQLGQDRGWLFRDVRGRFATDHPDLRNFALLPEREGGWSYGPHRYGAASTTPQQEPPALWTALTGRYRSFSPWYPTLRIYARSGHLYLAAPGGVEAPSDEEELVEVAPGVFRIGADEWLPERLRAGPQVDGRCVYVVRDGCHYSRTFVD